MHLSGCFAVPFFSFPHRCSFLIFTASKQRRKEERRRQNFPGEHTIVRRNTFAVRALRDFQKRPHRRKPCKMAPSTWRKRMFSFLRRRSATTRAQGQANKVKSAARQMEQPMVAKQQTSAGSEISQRSGQTAGPRMAQFDRSMSWYQKSMERPKVSRATSWYGKQLERQASAASSLISSSAATPRPTLAPSASEPSVSTVPTPTMKPAKVGHSRFQEDLDRIRAAKAAAVKTPISRRDHLTNKTSAEAGRDELDELLSEAAIAAASAAKAAKVLVPSPGEPQEAVRKLELELDAIVMEQQGSHSSSRGDSSSDNEDQSALTASHLGHGLLGGFQKLDFSSLPDSSHLESEALDDAPREAQHNPFLQQRFEQQNLISSVLDAKGIAVPSLPIVAGEGQARNQHLSLAFGSDQSDRVSEPELDSQSTSGQSIASTVVSEAPTRPTLQFGSSYMAKQPIPQLWRPKALAAAGKTHSPLQPRRKQRPENVSSSALICQPIPVGRPPSPAPHSPPQPHFDSSARHVRQQRACESKQHQAPTTNASPAKQAPIRPAEARLNPAARLPPVDSSRQPPSRAAGAAGIADVTPLATLSTESRSPRALACTSNAVRMMHGANVASRLSPQAAKCAQKGALQGVGVDSRAVHRQTVSPGVVVELSADELLWSLAPRHAFFPGTSDRPSHPTSNGSSMETFVL